ncbi:MAG TPA: ATP-binding cassette domain-containing protein [Balneolaceae bacterium]|nr:ATP-binding cassette domain-containing protein [Balneolaceae bacterium]
MPDVSGTVPLLKLHDATVYRGKNKILENFSVSVGPGEHTAIIGPNGSGKSTLIQLLTRQLYPVAHENGQPALQVFGKSRWKLEELRKHIGIVSSQLQYEISHNLRRGRISGRDVVLSGCFSSMQLFNHQTITDEMQSGADRALALMEAEYLADQHFNKMSAGEARRILIARALVTDPEILILDEPTTALDFVARKNCLNLIRNIAQSDRTVILVTHHIQEIFPEIEHVLLLKDGNIAYQGIKDQVLTSKNLSAVFDHPLTLHQNGERYRVEPKEESK